MDGPVTPGMPTRVSALSPALIALLSMMLGCGDESGADHAIPIDAPTSPTLPDGSLPDDGDGDAAGDTAIGEVTDFTDLTEVTPTETASVDTPSEATPTGPFVSIVIEGVTGDHAPADGLGSQTPTPYAYGLQRLELLRSAADPAPVTIFDYAPGYVAVDMHASNTVARVPIASLPDGTFTHFRIALTHVDMEVGVAFHNVPVVSDATTRMRILYGLAPVDIDVASSPASGSAHLVQGDMRLSGNLFGTPFVVTQHVESAAPVAGPGVTVSYAGGETHVTFMLAAPLVTSPEVPTDITHICRFFITGSFRWEDTAAPAHAPDVWDVDLAANGHPLTAEPVAQLGANGFATALIVGSAPRP